jgi:hypothetical protein
VHETGENEAHLGIARSSPSVPPTTLGFVRCPRRPAGERVARRATSSTTLVVLVPLPAKRRAM